MRHYNYRQTIVPMESVSLRLYTDVAVALVHPNINIGTHILLELRIIYNPNQNIQLH